MSTVLTNGVIIPDNGSRNWGGDLANNWNILDVNVGYMNDVKNRVTTLENSVAENTTNIQINTSNISALQTSKQDNLSEQQIANIADVTNKANDADVVHKSGGTMTGDLLCDGNHNLGTSTNKWKSLNGINPGALSLPNPSNSSMIQKTFPNSGGSIVADVDGWLEIRAKATSESAYIQFYVAGGGAVYAKNTGDNLMISAPVRMGVGVTIFYKDIETPTVCRLVPCMGNV